MRRFPRGGRPGGRAVAGLLLALLSLATADEPPRTGPVNLRGGAIRNVPTVVSFPLGGERSLVLALPESYWVQCPRYLPVPTCLAGKGMILQYMLPRGGSPSLFYVGVEPLERREGESDKARLERGARAFVDTLAAKYRAVEFLLTSPGVPLAPESLRVGGKKVPAWRAGPYATKPAGEYGGPRSVFSGTCVLFQPEGLDVLVYLALDAKSGGTTLERALADVSIQPTVAVNKTGRAVQLNDLFEGEPGRFPVRLCSFDLPSGFVVAPSVVELEGEWVYAEDRLDAAGAVTASWRMRQLPADREADPLEDGKDLRSGTDERGATPLRTIPLATPRVNAYAFTHTVEEGGRTGRGHTAVLRWDDLQLICAWVTWGVGPRIDPDGADKERCAADALAFDRLLGGMHVAVRW